MGRRAARVWRAGGAVDGRHAGGHQDWQPPAGKPWPEVSTRGRRAYEVAEKRAQKVASRQCQGTFDCLSRPPACPLLVSPLIPKSFMLSFTCNKFSVHNTPISLPPRNGWALCRMPICTAGERWKRSSRSTACRSLRMPETLLTSPPCSMMTRVWQRLRCVYR